VELTGAEIVVRCLEDEGTEMIFGYPGGSSLHIYDALYKQEKVRHILVRHEQAATHAADGYARSTGRTGVVLVTSGCYGVHGFHSHGGHFRAGANPVNR